MIFLEGTVVDPNGRSLAGVSLSNGELVVTTDAAGTYEIEALPGKHRFLTLSVPSGYVRPDPWFQRLDADAREDTRHQFNFVLESCNDASESFTVAHVTDLHMHTEEEGGIDEQTDICLVTPQLLTWDLGEIERELSPDFFLVTGDLTNEGPIPQFDALRSVIDQMSTELYPAFGMHDANVLTYNVPEPRVAPDSQIRDWFDESNMGVTVTGHFERMIGPTHYSFDRGCWHFVVYPNETHGFSIYDQLRMERWLDRDLSMQPKGTQVVIATHMPPRDDFLDRLAAHGVRLLLHGHTHSARVYGYGDILVAGTPSPCWGGSDTNPRGYRAIRFEGGSFEMEFCPLSHVQSGTVQENRAASGDAPSPALLWETNLPAHVHRAAPVPFEGDLLVSLQDEDDGSNSGICRVNCGDGRVVWHTKTDSAVRNSIAISADGGVFGVSHCGRLSRFDADSGEAIWSRDLWGYPHRWVATSPVLADDTVYVGAKSGYSACDTVSGELRWEARFSGTLDLSADEAGDKWGAYLTPLLFDDLLIVLVPRRSVMAINRKNGRIIWETPILGSQDYWASPLFVGERLISGAEPGLIMALQPQTGEVIWKEAVLQQGGGTNNYASGLTTDGHLVYGNTEDGCSFAFDADNGEVLWRYQTGPALLDMAPARRGGSALLAAPILYDNHLVVSGVDGCLHFLNRSTGACEVKMSLGSPVTAAPAAVANGLVVASWEGKMRCFAVPV